MEINYSLDRLVEDRKGRGHIIKELLSLKEKYRVINQKVIELGCGLGQNLEVFRDDNKVIGIEGLESVAIKGKESGLEILVKNLEFPFPDIQSESFDFVLCLDVLEHLVNPVVLSKEIERILRKDGKAVLNVPNHFDWGGRLKILRGHDIDTKKYFPDSYEWNLEHIRFFTYDGYLKMLDAAGLHVVENRSYVFNTFPLYNRLFKRFKLTKSLIEFICRKNTSLWAGGFFVVVEKKP